MNDANLNYILELLHRVLDDHIENMIKKYCSNIDVPSKPVHLNMCLDSDTSFVDLVKVSFLLLCSNYTEVPDYYNLSYI